MCLSPDGETLVSGSGDNSLRFWKLFPTIDDAKNYWNSDTNSTIGPP